MRSPARALLGRLGPAALALALVAGCSTDSASETTMESLASTVVTTTRPPVTAPRATATTVAPPPTAAVTEAPTTPTPPPPEPGALLAGALSTLGGSYRFSSTITVNGATAATASGDRVGDGTRFDVVSNETQVSYVVLPDTTWVRQGDGAWEELQDPPAAVDPIDALSAPSAVALVSGDAQSAQLDVTVPATALGIASEEQVVVHASIAGGALSSVVYETSASGSTAQSATTFGPVQDASPVVAPV